MPKAALPATLNYFKIPFRLNRRRPLANFSFALDGAKMIKRGKTL